MLFYSFYLHFAFRLSAISDSRLLRKVREQVGICTCLPTRCGRKMSVAGRRGM